MDLETGWIASGVAAAAFLLALASLESLLTSFRVAARGHDRYPCAMNLAHEFAIRPTCADLDARRTGIQP